MNPKRVSPLQPSLRPGHRRAFNRKRYKEGDLTIGSTFADAVSGLLLIALATTLVAHKQTSNVVKATTGGVAEDLGAAEGVKLGEP